MSSGFSQPSYFASFGSLGSLLLPCPVQYHHECPGRDLPCSTILFGVSCSGSFFSSPDHQVEVMPSVSLAPLNPPGISVTLVIGPIPEHCTFQYLLWRSLSLLWHHVLTCTFMSLMYISLLVHSIEQSTFFLSFMSALSSDIRHCVVRKLFCYSSNIPHCVKKSAPRKKTIILMASLMFSCGFLKIQPLC
jgi:hypothetical protein